MNTNLSNLPLEHVHLALQGVVFVFFATFFLFCRRYRGVSLLLLLGALAAGFASIFEPVTMVQGDMLCIIAMAIGPVLYLMMCTVTYKQRPGVLFSLAHFLPSFVLIFNSVDMQSLGVLAAASIAGYVVLSLRLMRKYHFAAFASRADAESSKINWLIWIPGMMLVSMFSQQWISYLVVHTGRESAQWFMIVSLLISIAVLAWSLIQALWLTQLFDGLEDYDNWADDHEVEVDEEFHHVAGHLYKSIDNYLLTEKAYLKPDLSLQDVAEKVGASPKNTCWAIYQGSGSNFCDYVNEFRIEAIKNELTKSQNSVTDIMQLAKLAGFNSQRSFETAFKRFTGKLPLQYMTMAHSD